MPNPTAVEALSQTLDDALERLHGYIPAEHDRGGPSQPLPSLLEQCETAVAAIQGPEPLRSIHHFACTGGTLISKALSALPNVFLLSELDPLSVMTPSTAKKMPFLPTDLIFALRNGIRPVEDDVVIDAFSASVAAAAEGVARRGQKLILRDHAHSQFCRDEVDFDTRPTLREMLLDRDELLSVVTVRHPLDSFLSVTLYNWVSFSPGTLDAYALRYLAFLDRYADVPLVRYEDFVADPQTVLEQLAGLLNLGMSPFVFELLPVIRMSGDSGRNDGPIAPRPRRAIPEELDAQRVDSPNYQALCRRLEYEP